MVGTSQIDAIKRKRGDTLADIKKVIKGLEYCIKSEDCRGCIYWEEIGLKEGCPLNSDALELLKEHDAVEAQKKDDGNPQPCTSWWYVCGNCGQEIEYHDRYCRWCGRTVKWNDR